MKLTVQQKESAALLSCKLRIYQLDAEQRGALLAFLNTIPH